MNWYSFTELCIITVVAETLRPWHFGSGTCALYMSWFGEVQRYFVTQSGTVSAKRVLENGIGEALNSQKSEGMQCSSIELGFPIVPIVDFNSEDAPQISQALGGASVIDIKRTTTKDDLLVMPPIIFAFQFNLCFQMKVNIIYNKTL